MGISGARNVKQGFLVVNPFMHCSQIWFLVLSVNQLNSPVYHKRRYYKSMFLLQRCIKWYLSVLTYQLLFHTVPIQRHEYVCYLIIQCGKFNDNEWILNWRAHNMEQGNCMFGDKFKKEIRSQFNLCNTSSCRHFSC